DHFMELDFEGFIAMVDALDGVPVCLPEALDDPAADLDLPAGEQVVGGKDALALARTRHAVGDGSDIARLGHQQMVMSAVVQEATSTGVLSRPDRLYAFLDATSSSLTVDPGLSRAADLAGLGTRISHVDPSRITFMTMPWEPALTDRNRVVPSADASEVFAALAADEPAVPQGEDSAPAPDGTATPGAATEEDGADVPGAGIDEDAARTADTDLCASCAPAAPVSAGSGARADRDEVQLRRQRREPGAGGESRVVLVLPRHDPERDQDGRDRERLPVGPQRHRELGSVPLGAAHAAAGGD